MISATKWPTDSILSWLCQILEERFGVRFDLTYTGQLVHLRLSDVSDASVAIGTDSTLFSDQLYDYPVSDWNAAAEGWASAQPGLLPAPGAAMLSKPLIQKVPSGYAFHYDVLGLTYWMLSRLEEIDSNNLDGHGRFPAVASHAYKHGYLERPIVDEWLHILGQVIQRTWPQLKMRQHQFELTLSHDVDHPSRYGFLRPRALLSEMARGLLRRRNLGEVLMAPWINFKTRYTLHSSDPYNTFEWIMDMSDKRGLCSAFYFICGRTNASKDANYNPEHPAIRELIRNIHARGHEIGLHPSYETYKSPEIIRAEAQRLRGICHAEGVNQPIWGGRMHYLRWAQPITMNAWQEAGMDYDSTLGYADLPGFRCGTCFEYPAFDPVQGQQLELRIRPLIAMECTITASRYMGLGLGERALEKFTALARACRSVNGRYALLWHNSELSTKAERELYVSILDAM